MLECSIQQWFNTHQLHPPKWEVKGLFYRILEPINGQDQTKWIVSIRGEIESSIFYGVEWD